ncbi:hypothetical protein C1645_734951 [Glomus cerebriforme]|uniref:F-box domain-containing protein n=1 Tax=Glomus cerebriforme TaxID=658196 RepID=A0A397TGY7_9GLOM|nr:hypothetical protein C1645_734951 [Glomus cerebriforme]
MARTLIKTGVDRFQDKRKRNLLKEEIYKLFINDCKNVKYIYWKEFPLFQYPGALTFFSQLCALGINHYFVTSRNLFEMGKICQNIKYLDVYECKGNDLGLINFIDIQKNLQSLLLYFNDIKKPCHIQFSEVTEKKAGTLKKFVLRPIIILLSPKFLLSLINLQHLELINDDNYNADESKEWQEWKKYLSISSFPNIQVLKTAFLLDPEYQGSEYDKKFIESIANYSKIEKLTIEIGAVNLDIVKNIFLNCKQLKKVNLSTSKKLPNGDELLEIITEYSSKNLCAFSFGDNWNFSVSGLRSFFENWRGRIPLKFNCYYDGMGAWTEEHIMIVKQYRDEGVIKG